MQYQSKLNIYETQLAIGILKSTFEKNLQELLNLKRVSAPLFVTSGSGINDNLNGVEEPVSFIFDNKKLEIVHSLAKWKRLALKEYCFPIGQGLYTDMNAIRKDEIVDQIHSIYVDQWDYELVISKEQRNLEFLKDIVRKIVKAIKLTSTKLKEIFPVLDDYIEDEVSFITTEELLKMYPALSPKERENQYVINHPTTFIIGIGDTLSDSKKHDGRSPDYDDWSLNGDIIFYNKVLKQAFEVSSMGIRVDKESLMKQLTKSNTLDRINLYFHQALLNDELPLTLGGGIGQSRLSMLLLEKMHIGEVQVSTWDQKNIDFCKVNNITLL